MLDDDACAAVHYFSNGIPRLINQLCDIALVYGFSDEKTTIDFSIIYEVADDIEKLRGRVLAQEQRVLRALAAEPALARVYREIEMPLVPVLARIERNGALVDAQLLGQQSVELGDKLVQLEREAFDIAGEEFNLGSPKQLCAILYDKLGCPVISKTAGGQPSTAESVLAELAERGVLPTGLALDQQVLDRLLQGEGETG